MPETQTPPKTVKNSLTVPLFLIAGLIIFPGCVSPDSNSLDAQRLNREAEIAEKKQKVRDMVFTDQQHVTECRQLKSRECTTQKAPGKSHCSRQLAKENAKLGGTHIVIKEVTREISDQDAQGLGNTGLSFIPETTVVKAEFYQCTE